MLCYLKNAKFLYIMDRRFNPIINRRLQAFAKVKAWSEMSEYLNNLSNSAFRTASYVMSEHVLVTLDDEAFWQCFSKIAASNTKVYLVTFLKAALINYKKHTLNFCSKQFLSFANEVQLCKTSIDRQKSLVLILPKLRTCEEACELLNAFCGHNELLKIHYLISATESKICYFVLFQKLRQSDLDDCDMAQILKMVLKRGSRMAYNFVSIMKSYFGLCSVGGVFSLQLNQYELSRLENNYENFVEVLVRM